MSPHQPISLPSISFLSSYFPISTCFSFVLPFRHSEVPCLVSRIGGAGRNKRREELTTLDAMGQGLGAGTVAGTALSMAVAPARTTVANHIFIIASGASLGLAVDFTSDCLAKQGKILIHRDVVLNAQDVIRHVYTFYAPCESNKISKLICQKHEWLVLESHGRRFYTVQKCPATGNVTIDLRMSLRAANDLGLIAAGRPTQTGEIRQHRADMEFDVPSDISVAYMIAWLRKEDPRWSFSTENSRHFTTRARYAINDF